MASFRLNVIFKMYILLSRNAKLIHTHYPFSKIAMLGASRNVIAVFVHSSSPGWRLYFYLSIYSIKARLTCRIDMNKICREKMLLGFCKSLELRAYSLELRD